MESPPPPLAPSLLLLLLLLPVVVEVLPAGAGAEGPFAPGFFGERRNASCLVPTEGDATREGAELGCAAGGRPGAPPPPRALDIFS